MGIAVLLRAGDRQERGGLLGGPRRRRFDGRLRIGAGGHDARRTDPRGRTYYWITGDHDREDQGINSDIAAFFDGYVTVTPLRFDLTDHDRVDEVRGWNLTL